MKLKYAMEMVELDDEFICVPVGRDAEKLHGVLKLNKSGYEIVKLLEEETTPDEIVSSLVAKYDTDYDTIRQYVDKIINVLRFNALIG